MLLATAQEHVQQPTFGLRTICAVSKSKCAHDNQKPLYDEQIYVNLNIPTFHVL